MYQTEIDQSRYLFQLNKLEEQINRIKSKLRWLWMTNLTAFIVCIIVHQYIGAAIAVVSWIVSLLGAVGTSRTKRILENTAMQYRNNLK